MKTVKILQFENKQLQAELQKKDSQIEKQSLYISKLEAALIDLKKHRFGARSEKSDPKQSQLFNEVELIDDEQKNINEPNEKNKSGTRKELPPELPSTKETHDLPDDQKTCPNDGTTLKYIGKVRTQELKLIPAKQLV